MNINIIILFEFSPKFQSEIENGAAEIQIIICFTRIKEEIKYNLCYNKLL